MFIVLLASIVSCSTLLLCMSLSNQKCEIQPTLINLHPNEYNQELHYYPFAVKQVQTSVLEVLIVLMNYLIEYVFQIKKKTKYTYFQYDYRKNETKILTKDISCKYKSIFDEKNVI